MKGLEQEQLPLPEDDDTGVASESTERQGHLYKASYAGKLLALVTSALLTPQEGNTGGGKRDQLADASEQAESAAKRYDEYREHLFSVKRNVVDRFTKQGEIPKDIKDEAAKLFPDAGLAQNLRILELLENRKLLKKPLNDDMRNVLRTHKLVGENQQAFEIELNHSKFNQTPTSEEQQIVNTAISSTHKDHFVKDADRNSLAKNLGLTTEEFKAIEKRYTAALSKHTENLVRQTAKKTDGDNSWSQYLPVVGIGAAGFGTTSFLIYNLARHMRNTRSENSQSTPTSSAADRSTESTQPSTAGDGRSRPNPAVPQGEGHGQTPAFPGDGSPIQVPAYPPGATADTASTAAPPANQHGRVVEVLRTATDRVSRAVSALAGRAAAGARSTRDLARRFAEHLPIPSRGDSSGGRSTPSDTASTTAPTENQDSRIVQAIDDARDMTEKFGAEFGADVLKDHLLRLTVDTCRSKYGMEIDDFTDETPERRALILKELDESGKSFSQRLRGDADIPPELITRFEGLTFAFYKDLSENMERDGFVTCAARANFTVDPPADKTQFTLTREQALRVRDVLFDRLVNEEENFTGDSKDDIDRYVHRELRSTFLRPANKIVVQYLHNLRDNIGSGITPANYFLSTMGDHLNPDDRAEIEEARLKVTRAPAALPGRTARGLSDTWHPNREATPADSDVKPSSPRASEAASLSSINPGNNFSATPLPPSRSAYLSATPLPPLHPANPAGHSGVYLGIGSPSPGNSTILGRGTVLRGSDGAQPAASGSGANLGSSSESDLSFFNNDQSGTNLGPLSDSNVPQRRPSDSDIPIDPKASSSADLDRLPAPTRTIVEGPIGPVLSNAMLYALDNDAGFNLYDDGATTRAAFARALNASHSAEALKDWDWDDAIKATDAIEAIQKGLVAGKSPAQALAANGLAFGGFFDDTPIIVRTGTVARSGIGDGAEPAASAGSGINLGRPSDFVAFILSDAVGYAKNNDPDFDLDSNNPDTIAAFKTALTANHSGRTIGEQELTHITAICESLDAGDSPRQAIRSNGFEFGLVNIFRTDTMARSGVGDSTITGGHGAQPTAPATSDAASSAAPSLSAPSIILGRPSGTVSPDSSDVGIFTVAALGNPPPSDETAHLAYDFSRGVEDSDVGIFTVAALGNPPPSDETAHLAYDFSRGVEDLGRPSDIANKKIAAKQGVDIIARAKAIAEGDNPDIDFSNISSNHQFRTALEAAIQEAGDTVSPLAVQNCRDHGATLGEGGATPADVFLLTQRMAEHYRLPVPATLLALSQDKAAGDGAAAGHPALAIDRPAPAAPATDHAQSDTPAVDHSGAVDNTANDQGDAHPVNTSADATTRARDTSDVIGRTETEQVISIIDRAKLIVEEANPDIDFSHPLSNDVFSAALSSAKQQISKETGKPIADNSLDICRTIVFSLDPKLKASEEPLSTPDTIFELARAMAKQHGVQVPYGLLANPPIAKDFHKLPPPAQKPQPQAPDAAGNNGNSGNAGNNGNNGSGANAQPLHTTTLGRTDHGNNGSAVVDGSDGQPPQPAPVRPTPERKPIPLDQDPLLKAAVSDIASGTPRPAALVELLKLRILEEYERLSESNNGKPDKDNLRDAVIIQSDLIKAAIKGSSPGRRVNGGGQSLVTDAVSDRCNGYVNRTVTPIILAIKDKDAHESDVITKHLVSTNTAQNNGATTENPPAVDASERKDRAGDGNGSVDQTDQFLAEIKDETGVDLGAEEPNARLQAQTDRAAMRQSIMMNLLRSGQERGLPIAFTEGRDATLRYLQEHESVYLQGANKAQRQGLQNLKNELATLGDDVSVRDFLVEQLEPHSTALSNFRTAALELLAKEGINLDASNQATFTKAAKLLEKLLVQSAMTEEAHAYIEQKVTNPLSNQVSFNLRQPGESIKGFIQNRTATNMDSVLPQLKMTETQEQAMWERYYRKALESQHQSAGNSDKRDADTFFSIQKEVDALLAANQADHNRVAALQTIKDGIKEVLRPIVTSGLDPEQLDAKMKDVGRTISEALIGRLPVPHQMTVLRGTMNLPGGAEVLLNMASETDPRVTGVEIRSSKGPESLDLGQFREHIAQSYETVGNTDAARQIRDLSDSQFEQVLIDSARGSDPATIKEREKETNRESGEVSEGTSGKVSEGKPGEVSESKPGNTGRIFVLKWMLGASLSVLGAAASMNQLQQNRPRRFDLGEGLSSGQ